MANGAKIDAADKGGSVPLHWAANSGADAVLKKLLELKADPNATNRQGETAMHWAASNDQQRSVSALIDARADMTIRSTGQAKLTPLEAAKVNGQRNTAIFMARFMPTVEGEDDGGMSL